MLNVNEYFDGKVKSIAFQGAEGHVTSGVMAAGEYTFGTSQHEVMRVVYGELVVRFAGSEAWQAFPAGSEFSVEANSSFDLQVAAPTAYLCFYS
ncbi:MAG TPA: pyrimidine/purine nucleoside phosphorylase [Pseudomonadales bacterium]|nr:pyrimidine/purine nucleoside phosphorylase [Pseudomonadales bacterium]